MRLEEVDVGTVAAVIGKTERQVQRLVKDGVITKTSRGSYHLPTAVQSWAAWMVNGRPAGDISAERKKLLAAQARIKTVEARVAEASVVSWNDAQAIMNEIATTYVTLMEGLPGRLASQLAGMTDTAAIRKLLLDELRQIRTAAADRFEKLAAMAHGGPDPRTPTRKPAGTSKRARRRDHAMITRELLLELSLIAHERAVAEGIDKLAEDLTAMTDPAEIEARLGLETRYIEASTLKHMDRLLVRIREGESLPAGLIH